MTMASPPPLPPGVGPSTQLLLSQRPWMVHPSCSRRSLRTSASSRGCFGRSRGHWWARRQGRRPSCAPTRRRYRSRRLRQYWIVLVGSWLRTSSARRTWCRLSRCAAAPRRTAVLSRGSESSSKVCVQRQARGPSCCRRRSRVSSPLGCRRPSPGSAPTSYSRVWPQPSVWTQPSTMALAGGSTQSGPSSRPISRASTCS
mmetsp:Transcript_35802/g.102932  ORF Transcript_35802/g.102932 Transcript_35802/m.102932 type:complete len:200 (-) Transcript_35802:2072-2671(-)